MEQTLNRRTRFWDDIAEEYAEKPVALPDAYEQKLEITKARLSVSDTVLDIGCGTGSLALELAPAAKHVHSVDVSVEMVRIAKRKVADARVENVTVHRSAVEDALPFEPASFEMVCAYNILHLVDDTAATLRELFSLAKPGAWFISSTACLRETWVPYGLIIPVMRWLGKAPPVHMLGVAQLEAGMRDAGFVDITRHPVSPSKTTAFIVAKKPL